MPKYAFDAARKAAFDSVLSQITGANEVLRQYGADSMLDLFTDVESKIYEQPVMPLLFRELVPINTTQRPGVDAIQFHIAKMVGSSNTGEGSSASAINRVQVKFEPETIQVKKDTVSYSYTLDELEATARFGGQLDTRSAKAARTVSEQSMNQTMLYGWGNKKNDRAYCGLFNSPDVEVVKASGGWLNEDGTGNAKAILGTINRAIGSIMKRTGGDVSYLPDYMPMPTAALSVMGDQISDGSSDSILSWVSKNNIATLQSGKPLKFRAAPGLDTAGENGRALLYSNNEEFIYAALTRALDFIAPQWDGFNIKVPGRFACTGAVFVQPYTAVYVDGILGAATQAYNLKLNKEGQERVEALKAGEDTKK
ncbi:major capsid family protein [Erwinia sp. HR93]|uniref:major capsid family protein n=1 Tax=Erwinia sp. HR93 TaxID=3094840 RepID=UPI002ADED089|nr:major capsid family protein [Erwinia sp. HR93]MEA1064740.1 major capsid family protein [Erwinia sp. HR93]